MSARGNGGFWNRAGRRSGGARPATIIVPRPRPFDIVDGVPVRYTCPDCANDNLPHVATRGCDSCRMVIELHDAGKMVGLVREHRASRRSPEGTDQK